MKIFKSLTFASIFILSVISISKFNMYENAYSNLIMDNVEALAENWEIIDLCFLKGSYRCPVGGYTIYNVFTLDKI